MSCSHITNEAIPHTGPFFLGLGKRKKHRAKAPKLCVTSDYKLMTNTTTRSSQLENRKQALLVLISNLIVSSSNFPRIYCAHEHN